MQTSNPVFNSSTYQDAPSWMGALSDAQSKPKTMSVQGTAWKTLYLLAITIVTAAVSFGMYRNNPGMILPTMIGSLVGGLVASVIMLKKPQISSFVVPIFAFSEGLFVAAISVAIVFYSPLASKVGGDVAAYTMIGQAAGLSLAITAAMLFGYATGVLRLSNFAAKVVGVMVGGVMFYYLAAFIVNLIFGSGTIPRVDYMDGPIGIGFSVFVVILASVMLLLDFRFIDDGVQRGLPKYYEWIGAFGILTTVVWLYIEILKLLAKLKSE
ncbi:MAG: Bax inhibitor-1/YccA family protein [Phycisphaerales bacterium]